MPKVKKNIGRGKGKRQKGMTMSTLVWKQTHGGLSSTDLLRELDAICVREFKGLARLQTAAF